MNKAQFSQAKIHSLVIMFAVFQQYFFKHLKNELFLYHPLPLIT